MRRHLLTSVMLLSAILSAHSYSLASSFESFQPDTINLGEETVEVNGVYIPKGFDANDHVEIIATGVLPTPCFRRPYGVVEKFGNDIKIIVKATHIADRSHACIEMAVPYLVSVPVGTMPTGRYSVEVNSGTNAALRSVMEIETPSSNSIDDFLYANVEQVSVDRATRTVTLTGENPSPCIELDKIVSSSNGLNTYAVLPIMRKKEASCPQVLTPFEYKYQLPHDLSASKVLVHVRTLNGHSINTILTAIN